MGRKKIILSGVINGFKILSYEGNRYYNVLCPTCLNTKIIRADGITEHSSCGCMRGNFKHGLYEKGPMYFMWHDMKNRCYNPKADRYNRYGERGISVCDEWITDFEAFHNWVILNGWKEGLQIDRINNDGNYTPNNCQFITSKENSRKRGNTVWVSLDGINVCLSEACENIGFDRKRYKAIHRFIKKGFTFDESICKTENLKIL